MIPLARRLWGLLTSSEHKQLGFLFFLMLVGALLETLGVGVIFPVINMIAHPDYLETHAIAKHIAIVFGVTNYHSFILLASSLVLGVFVVKNLFLAFLQYQQSNFIFKNQTQLADRLFLRHLYSDYLWHLGRNTADLLKSVNIDTVYVYQNVLMPYLMIASEGLVVLTLLSFLFVLAPWTTLIAVVIQGGMGAVLFLAMRRPLGRMGAVQQEKMGEMIKWVNQGLGGIKETKVTQSERYFVSRFRECADTYAQSQRIFYTLNQIPRFVLETLTISTLPLVVAYFVWSGKDLLGLVPTFAAYAMAAFRCLPAATRVLSSMSLIRYYSPSFEAVVRDMEAVPGQKEGSQELPSVRANSTSFEFLSFSNVSFCYPERVDPAVKDLSLRIVRNSSIAFVGHSGAGKSTVVDLLLGLLEPSSGTIDLDGKNIHENIRDWQTRVGYVPQTIFLTDDSIRRNVALGVADSEISDAQVWQTLEWVQLAEFVRMLPEGLDTQVGERGVRLSGGQRQRIGIARALYRNPEILVLDEATSALDTTTEQEIMKAITSLKGKKTFVIVAHRLSTIQGCDQIYFLHGGNLIDHGSFSEILGRNSEFRRMAHNSDLREIVSE